MTIKILSDGNELELVGVEKGKNGNINVFKYIKSVTKLGWEIRLTDEEVCKLKKHNNQ